jgi:hypothetical protein
VKHALAPGGLLARFQQGSHAELLQAIEETPAGPALRLHGVLRRVPL